MKLFSRLFGGRSKVVKKLKKGHVCLHKIVSAKEERNLDPRGTDSIQASMEIKKKYLNEVGYNCPGCDGKNVMCPKFIGVNPEAYRRGALAKKCSDAGSGLKYRQPLT